MERSYFATMTLLILHQIDAAYWREWEMFFLPGGVQGYLVFNLIAIPVVLIGYRHIIQQTPQATKYAYLCASLGLLTFAIHAIFLWIGHKQFTLPFSLLIITSCLASSLWQLVHIWKYKQQIKEEQE